MELDRKLESLERLQVLLQTHISPKHGNTGNTPKNNRDQSMLQNLPTVEERSEITETLTSTSIDGDTAAIGTNSESDAGERTSTKGSSIPVGSPEISSASSKEIKPSPPRNGASSSEKTVSWDVADAQKLKVPVMKRTAREQKKADEDRLSLRKSMFDKVNVSIRNTLSSFSLPPPIEVRTCYGL